jgi:23S rRNA pseudouridine2605 synthase
MDPRDRVDPKNPAVRVQKLLAERRGISRRKAEILLKAGKVRLADGSPLKPGDRIPPKEGLLLEGRLLKGLEPEKVYFAFYKPRGVLCSFETPKGLPTLANSFPIRLPHLYSVGRLDVMAEGLLLVTNDGEFANRVAHPRYGVDKEYFVKIQGKMDEERLQSILKGVKDFGETLKARRVTIVYEAPKNQWLLVVMNEGRYREIRRMFWRIGYYVLKIKRIRIGPITLGKLRPGQARPLLKKEFHELFS